jgi:hypothetical protein
VVFLLLGTKPSISVIVECEECERCFQRMKVVVGNHLPQASTFPAVLGNVVLSQIVHCAFTKLDSHVRLDS